MEFGIEKWVMLEDKIRKLRGKVNYKYLGIFTVDTMKQEEMKDKIQKEYLRRI